MLLVIRKFKQIPETEEGQDEELVSDVRRTVSPKTSRKAFLKAVEKAERNNFNMHVDECRPWHDRFGIVDYATSFFPHPESNQICRVWLLDTNSLMEKTTLAP